MGLFSNKKKVKVSTSIEPMANDNTMPHSFKQAVVKGILVNGDVAGNLLDESLNGVPVKAARMYRYARDNYPFGLPTAEIGSSVENSEIVRTLISSQVGHQVTLEYIRFHPLSLIHLGWQKIVQELGYVAETNELTVLSKRHGFPVYLRDLKAYMPQAEYAAAVPEELEVFGVPASAGYSPSRKGQAIAELSQYIKGAAVSVDPDAVSSRVEVEYSFESVTTQEVGGITYTHRDLRHGTHTFTELVYDTEADYYQVRYSYQVPVPNTRPQVFTKHTGFWSYNEEDETYAELSENYQDDLPAMGSNYPFLYFIWDFAGVAEIEHKKTDAFKTSVKMMNMLGADYESLAKDIYLGSQEEVISALMVFGVKFKGESEEEKEYLYHYMTRLHQIMPSGKAADGTSQAIVIKDARFKMSLSYDRITTHELGGKVANIRRYAGGYKDGYHYYQRQITESTYREVRVYGVRNSFNIRGKYSTAFGAANDNVFAPLDYTVLDNVSMIRRESLILRSMHIMINTYYEEVTKWYQSGAFKVIMAIIVVIISVFTAGAGAGLWAVWGTVSTFAMTVALMLVQLAVVNIAVTALIQIAVKTLGPEFAMLLAIVGAVYGASGGAGTIGKTALLSAKQVMSASLNLLDAAVAATLQNKQLDLMKEIQEFTDLKDAQDKELDKLMKELAPSNLLDPFDFIGDQPYFIFGEAPESLYTRTVHSGNTSGAMVSEITNFVELKLRLPDAQEQVV